MRITRGTSSGFKFLLTETHTIIIIIIVMLDLLIDGSCAVQVRSTAIQSISSTNVNTLYPNSPFETNILEWNNINPAHTPSTSAFSDTSNIEHTITISPTCVVTEFASLPFHYLKLILSVNADTFDKTLFLLEFSQYLSFNPENIQFHPVLDSDKEIAVYVHNDLNLTTEFINNFVTVWNNGKNRAAVFPGTTKQVVGYAVVPGIAPSQYLKLRLCVLTDQFDTTLFLMEFSTYINFVIQSIVIEPSPYSDMEVWMYVRNSDEITSEFRKNFVVVWDDEKLRNKVFSSAIIQQIAGYVTDTDADGLPGWGVALIIVFLVVTVTASLIFVLVFCKKSRRESKYGKASFSRVSWSQMINACPDRDSSKASTLSQRLPVPSRKLTISGLTEALENEKNLVKEFENIPLMMSSSKNVPAECFTKNRYKHVLPSPKSRVSLFLQFDQPTSDYINANYIRGYNNKAKAYIATQGPMECTTSDFWRMVWEQNVSVILMATNLVEGDKIKCAHYWPDCESRSLNDLRICDHLEVSLISREENDYSTTSRFCLKEINAEISREVSHHWFRAWPINGVPEDPSDLISYLEAIRTDTEESKGPIVVHCSNGIGRTGVVLAIHIGMQQLKESKSCDVLETVWKLRQDRGGLIQTEDQYIFTYTALEVYAKHLEIVLDEESRKLQSTPELVCGYSFT